MNLDARQIFNVFSRMSSRERWLVGLAAAGLVGTCLYSFGLDPLINGKARLQTQVVQKKKELQAIIEQRKTYLDVAQKLKAGLTLLAKVNPNFPLLTHLETTISQVIPRERINSMSPSSKPIGDEYEENIVEVKLSQVSLQQLVDMLYRIEKGEQPLRVTRLQVKKRYNDPRNFDVVATVSLVRATA